MLSTCPNHDFPSQRPQQHRNTAVAGAIAKSDWTLSSRGLANIVLLIMLIYLIGPISHANLLNARGIIRRTHARMRTCIH